MIREICKDEAFLAQKAELATPEDLQVAADLLDTLIHHKEGCVGLAANMIGVNKRIIAFDNDGSYMVMFNPQIIKKAEPYDTEEGCLSLPGISVPITRNEISRVRFYDLDGKVRELESDGLLGRCFQHEIDHLNGITLLESCSPMDKVKALHDYHVALANGAKPGETE